MYYFYMVVCNKSTSPPSAKSSPVPSPSTSVYGLVEVKSGSFVTCVYLR